jgi:hypothetical protein
MSALPSEADMLIVGIDVCYVPEADMSQLAVAQSTFRTGGSVPVWSRISLRGEGRRRRTPEIIAVEMEGDGVRCLSPRQFPQGRGV